jgi:hypothetical protein
MRWGIAAGDFEAARHVTKRLHLSSEHTWEEHREKKQERKTRTRTRIEPADHGLHHVDIDKEKRGPISFENRPRESECG